MNKYVLFFLSMWTCASSFAQNKEAAFPVKQEPTSEYEMMIKNLQFDQTLEKIKKDMVQAKKKKKDTAELENLQERCNRGIQMLRGTDHVVIIDSVVVDKKNFLDAYNYSEELGLITPSKDGKTTTFETQRGNRIYKPELAGSSLQLTSYYLESGKPTNKKNITGLEVDGDLNYPFLMTDGTTFYFAARSAEGLGNYDLYVTRYDYDEDKFYKAENLGFPYNSYANDYLMVIDEENKIGWFASDRYQPDNKVCIYTFIPNSSRHPYDYENDEQDVIIAAASLRSFKSTWDPSNEQARIEAKQRLSLMNNSINGWAPYDFTLVINDNFTYHYYKEFRSAEAKNQCREWMQKVNNLNKANYDLELLRNQYATANAAKKKSMRQQMLNLETQVEKLTREAHEAEKKTRNLEIKSK